MQKITPHLWFDTQAKEAAELYTSAFPNSRIKNATTLHETPSGDADMLTIELCGQEFMMISAGPYFTPNPSISFLVACKTKEEVDRLWAVLSQGGMALMELGAYPFSEHYGWIQDRYGLSWQIMFFGNEEITQAITPTFMFVGDVCGKAEEAMKLYTSIFHNAHIDNIMRYGKDQAPDTEGTVVHAAFTLEGQQFAAMDSAQNHAFSFNEAVSMVIHCENQEEIDYYWGKLSAVPEAEQCGWLKDQYGVSWQVVPTVMAEMFQKGTAEQMARVTQCFLKMKKFDIATLQAAYDQQ